MVAQWFLCFMVFRMKVLSLGRSPVRMYSQEVDGYASVAAPQV
jgi:hypothetical protein